MSDLYRLLRPALFRLPAETAHAIVLKALGAGLGHWLGPPAPDPPELRQRVWGIEFPNPVGLAAGFDKDARVIGPLLALGFGFVEIGTVTPRAQPGNPRPRLFRLEEDLAVVNRMGFNSRGLGGAVVRLAARHGQPGIVGVNLGRNRDSKDAGADYAVGITRTAGLANYLVINVSSPNTPGLRDLQRRTALDALLQQVLSARESASTKPPLLLKIAPDLTPQEQDDIATVALARGIDGLVVANTTVARPIGLASRHAAEAGGLSGRPLFGPSTELLARMYRLTGRRLPLIGVGGIATAEDAYAKIRAGASLVQLYTALVFAGPGLVREIKAGLDILLRRDGFATLAEAVGTAV